MDRLFLDTTYLLPLLGVDVGLRDYEKYFPRLHLFYEIYFSPLSLIEAKWIIIRLLKHVTDQHTRERLLQEYRNGIDIFLNTQIYTAAVITNSVIEEIADILWTKGVKDYFDRMIYAAAAYYNAILLTEDYKLRNIHNETELSIKPINLIDWNKLIKTLKAEIRKNTS